jgi:hypothetical protein
MQVQKMTPVTRDYFPFRGSMIIEVHHVLSSILNRRRLKLKINHNPGVADTRSANYAMSMASRGSSVLRNMLALLPQPIAMKTTS